jgi:hypothetical protein
MTREEAIAYSRLAPSTFAKWSAEGRIPSHGERAKLYNRDEVVRLGDDHMSKRNAKRVRVERGLYRKGASYQVCATDADGKTV